MKTFKKLCAVDIIILSLFKNFAVTTQNAVNIRFYLTQ